MNDINGREVVDKTNLSGEVLTSKITQKSYLAWGCTCRCKCAHGVSSAITLSTVFLYILPLTHSRKRPIFLWGSKVICSIQQARRGEPREGSTNVSGHTMNEEKTLSNEDIDVGCDLQSH